NGTAESSYRAIYENLSLPFSGKVNWHLTGGGADFLNGAGVIQIGHPVTYFYFNRSTYGRIHEIDLNTGAMFSPVRCVKYK
ncbi:MAG: hypothetical protein ACRCX4_04650, partial [Bacteroidales bacterium]